jgi:ubiquinone/menaquinone biosynthesis C-methylase UbiE
VVIDRPPVIDYEGSNYQTDFWESGGREYEHQVEMVAMQRLLPASGKLLLELGAGAGRNTPSYGAFDRVVLLDYSLSQLRLAQEKLGVSKRYSYVAADIYRLPFVSGLFDAATMIRVLHHMVNAPLALRQVRRVLQQGAVFILEFANKRHLKAILRYLLRRQDWNPFSLDPVEIAALNFDFHPNAVRGWLRNSGFAIERQLTVSHFRMDFVKRYVPLPLLVKMDSWAQLTGNWWQFTPSVFVRSLACGSLATGAPTMDISCVSPGSFLACPECSHYPLEKNSETVSCPACSLRWSIDGGIYDFRRPIPTG